MANLKDLLVNGPSNLIGDVTVNKIRLTSLEIPTSNNGTEYDTGSNGKILKSNGTSVYWANDDNITSFTITANATDGLWDLTGTNGTNSVTYALAPYSSKQTTASFYTGTTNPTLTTRLNYDGYLYAKKLYSEGSEVITKSGGTINNSLILQKSSTSPDSPELIFNGQAGNSDAYKWSIQKNGSGDLIFSKTSLNNTFTTTIVFGANGYLLPNTTDTYDLGSSSKKWRNIYGNLKGNADTATTLSGEKTPNYVYAGPSSGTESASPAFRALVSADIPSLDVEKITTGIFPVTRGGTGNTSFIENRLIYSETNSKLSSSGHYVSNTKISINSTSETDYNLFVNGTSNFNGNITLQSSNTISRVGRGTNWYKTNTDALFRMTTATTSGGWSPFLALKASNGWWSMGALNNCLLFGFLSDVDVYGETNAKNHFDYKIRLLPTIYEQNTSTITDRAFITAPYSNNLATVGSASLPIYINDTGVATSITPASLFSNFSSSINTISITIAGETKTANAINNVSNSWGAGTSDGPTIQTTVNGVSSTAIAIPSAGSGASGIVTTSAQQFDGNKTFKGDIYPKDNNIYILGKSDSRWQKIYVNELVPDHEYTKNLIIEKDNWIDTGIQGTDIDTGTNIIQIYSNNKDIDDPKHWYTYWSGIFSWYNGSIHGGGRYAEIPLHGAGHDLCNRELYLRVFMPTTNNSAMKLQIKSNFPSKTSSEPASMSLVFKIKHIM